MAKVDGLASFIAYTQEVKPFHTKMIESIAEYIHTDVINVSFTEEIQWIIEVEHDLPATYCVDGFGLTPFGYLTDGESTVNPNYNNASVDYVPQLDQTHPLYDYTFTLSSPMPTLSQLLASVYFVDYNALTAVSFWDVAECYDPTLVHAEILECIDTNLTFINSFNNDFHLTFDAQSTFQYVPGVNGTIGSPPSYRFAEVIQTGYVGTKTTGVAKLYSYMDHGKWYWEINVISATGNLSEFRVGVIESDPILYELPYSAYNDSVAVGDNVDCVGYAADGTLHKNGVVTPYGSTYTSGDVIGVALDLTANTMEFFKNGGSQGVVASAFTNTTSRAIFPTFLGSPASWIPPLVCDGDVVIDYNVFSPAISMELTNGGGNVSISAELGNLTYSAPVGFSLLEPA